MEEKDRYRQYQTIDKAGRGSTTYHMPLQNLQQLLMIGARGARKHSPFELVDLSDGFGQGVGEKLILIAERGGSSAGHWEESSWDGRSVKGRG